MTDRQINNTQLRLVAGQIKALAHPLRLSILLFIDKNKTVNVNRIYNTLKLEQSITSQHLKILVLPAWFLPTVRENLYFTQ